METFVEAGHSTGGHALISSLLLLLYNPGLDTLDVYHVRRSIDQLIYYYYTRSNCVIILRYLHNASHKNYDRTDPLNVVGDHDDLWEPNNRVIERSYSDE